MKSNQLLRSLAAKRSVTFVKYRSIFENLALHPSGIWNPPPPP